MLENIELLCHNSIRMEKDKVIYIDPFKIKKEMHDADIIFVTHNHYDHLSKEDILKINNNETIYVVTKDIENELLNIGINKEKIMTVEPYKKYSIGDIRFETIPAYNIEKEFHKKEDNWVGYIIEINGIRYYVAGDTDITEENRRVKCDVAFVPIGGTYTMNYTEAAKLVNEIKPKIVIPTHYGDIVGKKEDGEKFLKEIKKEIECKLFI